MLIAYGKKKRNNKKKYKDFWMDSACDIAGAVFYSIGVYTFAKMADFAPGGLTGLALIMNHIWNLPIGIMTLVLNIPFGRRKEVIRERIGMFYSVPVPRHKPIWNGTQLMK